MAQQGLTRLVRQVWLVLLAGLSQAQAGWVPAGLGDCPGPQVRGSAGETPEEEQCTPEFVAKTALCFTQVCYPGCQYIDVPTKDCKGGAEMAHVYTCVPNRPEDPGVAPGR